LLRNNFFARNRCSLISNWFDMREQVPGANLLHESVQEQALWCVLKFACRDMTCLQLANQISLFFIYLFIFFFHPQLLLRVYWLRYLPGSAFREQAPSCVPALNYEIYRQLQNLCIREIERGRRTKQ